MKTANRRQRRARMEPWVQTALPGAQQQEREKCGRSWRKLRPECRQTQWETGTCSGGVAGQTQASVVTRSSDSQWERVSDFSGI